MAATFIDLESGRAVRLAAKESSKLRAREMHPGMESKNQQQMAAYARMSAEELFDVQWVRVPLGPEEFPGYKAGRVICAECGEGINFSREVRRGDKVLCRACSGERYYEPV